MIHTEFSIACPDGAQISGDLRRPDTDGQMPLIIISHGFKGFRQWGFIPYLAESLSRAGAISITFNFSLNGKTGAGAMIDRMEDFARNTIARQLQDLDLLITEIGAGKVSGFPMQQWNGDIYMVGHSLGGGISILTATENKSGNIKKVAVWASVARFDRYTPRQKAIWQKQGYIEFPNQATGQTLKLYYSYIKDFENNNEKYNLPLAVSSMVQDLLVVHGRQDVTAPLKEAEALMEAGPGVSRHIVDQTGHTFNVEHPMQGTNPRLNEAIEATKDFFELG